MELKELVTLYRRWIWFLIVGVIIGLAAGLIASKIQTPVYEASTKVLITRNRQPSGADILSISDQQLVLTYQQLLKTQPVIGEAESRLDVSINPDNIKVDVIPSTPIIQIKVQNKNAEQATAIANALVQILIEQNETLQAGRYSISEEGLNSQIARVQVQINDLQDQIAQSNRANVEEQLTLVGQQITDLHNEISNLEKEIAVFSVFSPADRASLAEKQAQLDELRSLLYLYQQIKTNLTFIGQPVQGNLGRDDSQIASLQATLDLYQQVYLDLLNNLEAVKLARVQSTPTVTQIEKAAIPEKPVSPIPLLYTALSGMVGLFIAAGAILLVDYFDDTLKSSKKTQDVLGIPVIGEIAETDQNNKVGNFYSANQANSSLLNSFGILRINVSRLVVQKSLKSILITSPAPNEGKTTIATNLAAALVQAGKKVILLDADLYHPALHSLLGLDNNQRGLSDILSDGLKWQDVAHDFGGITIITSGTHSPSSTVLLESDEMTQLLTKLQKEADVVIVDGPPLFIVDSQILASKVGGTLLVVRQGGTITAVARAMVDQLKSLNLNVFGAVLNRVPQVDTYYFDRYYHNTRDDRPGEKMEKIEVSQS